MRILYWTPEFYPEIGGVEILSWKALPALRELDHEFLVVASHGNRSLPDVSELHGMPIHRFRFREILWERNPRKTMLCRKQIAELKRSFRPDLVHYHFGGPYGFFHVTTATAHPSPTLVTLHSSVADHDCGPHTLLGKLLRQASWVTGVSNATLAAARRAVPGISARASVIYNGLESPDTIPAPIPFDEPRILCLGRAVEGKGFSVAVEAFADTGKRFPGSRLVIAGDGPAREGLEQQVAALGLSKSVEFSGWVDPEQVPELINRSTMVVLPSLRREEFPLVALEAAQMSRPVVASRVGGMEESVVHEQTGLLVEGGNPGQLAEAIALLLEHPDMAVRYGQAGRERAGNVFSLERYVEDYDRLYRELGKGRE